MAAIRLESALMHELPAGDKSVFVFDDALITRREINLLRQAIFTQVPVLAFNSAIIYRNDTGYPLEQILHSFNSIVLDDRANANLTEAATFHLDISVPDTIAEAHTFYANDLVSQTPGVTVLQPLVPVIVLQPGDRIVATFEAIRGIGSTHSKFFPVTVVYNPAERGTGRQHLHVESRGAYTPREIFDLAIGALQAQ